MRTIRRQGAGWPASIGTLCLGLALFIPWGIAGEPGAGPLERERQELERERLSIERERRSLNAECSRVPADDEARVQECRARQQRVLSRMRNYQRAAAEFKNRKERLEKIDAELVVVGQRIERTRREIERYSARLKDYQASLEEWAKLPLDARDKARHAAKEAAATVLLEKLAQRKEQAVALNEDALARVPTSYWQHLRELPFTELVRRQKTLYDSVRSAKTEADVIAALSVFKDGVAALPAVPPREREEALTVILKVIGAVNSTAIRNPAIGLLIADGELVIADLYAWMGGLEARRRINELLNLGDDHLKAIAALTTQYKSDIDARSRLAGERAKLLVR
ncbi:MAG: hypothetical protein HYY85_20610 [Deltaproteobacteria bacterium]|nr:hypothetical protein [Deltaproteobacteria bacterium]